MDNLNYTEFFPDVVTEAHCVMVDLPNNPAIMEYIKNIPDDVIYEDGSEEYGREKTPHITVLYGIVPAAEEKAKNILKNIPKNISATLGKISKFENADSPFDVLKIEVNSPHLTKINDVLKRNCENVNEWPDYKPHVTLAYVKKGTCNDRVGDTRFSGIKMTFKSFMYSNGVRQENAPILMKEYNVGTSGGYGGGAMAGGPTAPVNWAGTNSSQQTSRRLKDYPASRRYSYVQGNTIIGSSLYDTITKDDLKHEKFGPTELFAGLRYEMKRMEYPDKDVARPTVLKNLEKNPKYYSDLDMYLNSDK